MASPSARPSSSRCTSLKGKSKKAKARGEEQQPALPGLEPSPAWLRMQATPKRLKAHEDVKRTDAGPGHPSWRNNVVPGKCTCGDQTMEDNGVRGIQPYGSISKGEFTVIRGTPSPTGVPINPWVVGHATWCSMFMPKCDACGRTSGTHTPECSFWKLHPEITPF